MSQLNAAAFDLGGDFAPTRGVRFDDARADHATRAKFFEMTVSAPSAKLMVKAPVPAPKAKPAGMDGPKFFN